MHAKFVIRILIVNTRTAVASDRSVLGELLLLQNNEIYEIRNEKYFQIYFGEEVL